ncbi:MAG: response regulator [Spirochaetes bacterium]|nr:response regulator [Spirochaetota bacterium]
MDQKAKILVVDDEYANVFLMKNLLIEEYEIETGKDGEEALAKLEIFKPDLILLDIMMPGISGIEVCQKITQMKEYVDIPIIMVTAKSDENDIKDGLEAGAIDYIKKPFSEIELKARIKTALRLKFNIDKLKEAANKIKTLNELLPICSSCKKIRDDQGYWNQVDEYMKNHSDLEFTHTLCPDCMVKLYPTLNITPQK